MGTWVFDELRGSAVRREPREAELFRTEQSEEDEYAGTDALVREVLQNSIDAGSGEGPVRVRIAIHDAIDAPAADRLAHYFLRLKAPLSGRRIQFRQNGAPKLPCRFLVCEDFGTRGLEGDTTLAQDPPPGGPPQDFFWFWRNIGRSAKTGDDLGRWGLGKTVYRAASRVGCMFGLTVRRSDNRRLVIGQAVLQIHTHGGQEFLPEGFWCSDVRPASGLPLPIESSDEVRRFVSEWRLTRTTEPGLSVVAPYVPDELRADRILQAVAVHFFARIVRGELVVEVVGPGVGRAILDAANIDAACREIEWNGPKRTKRHAAPPIEFARQCLQETPGVETTLLGQASAPEFGDDAIKADELHALRHRFAAGERVSLRARICLPRRDDANEVGEIDVYLQRRSDGARCDSYYVREGMTITKINSRVGLRGVQALVVVEPGPMAKLLGDTEGPAHEDWDKSAERPDREWQNWKNKVGFARRIVDNLAEWLTPPSTQPDFDLLSEYFSLQRTKGEQRQRVPGAETDGAASMDPIEPKPRWYRVWERKGGFTLARSHDAPLPMNAALKISIAYDLPRGDPLKSWSPFDFEISSRNGGLVPIIKGAHVKLLQRNVARLDNLEEDFEFSLDGFDQHRDVYVRVDELTEKDEAAIDEGDDA